MIFTNAMNCSVNSSHLVEFRWFSLSRNKKIKSKPFNDRSYEFQILLKISLRSVRCLCASYLPKLSTQIYKAQYGDAIFVSFLGAQIWPP